MGKCPRGLGLSWKTETQRILKKEAEVAHGSSWKGTAPGSTFCSTSLETAARYILSRNLLSAGTGP